MITELASPISWDITGGTQTATHESYEVHHAEQAEYAIVTRHLGIMKGGRLISLKQDHERIADVDPAGVEDDVPTTDYTDLLAAEPDGKKQGRVRTDDFEAAFKAIQDRRS
jgi:hypothetical protein